MVCNFTPVVRYGYRIGAPLAGSYREVMNSDSELYGGSNVGNAGGVTSEPVRWHAWDQSILLTLPPLGVLILKFDADSAVAVAVAEPETVTAAPTLLE